MMAAMTGHTAIPLLKFRRTKIVATLGPSSSAPETIGALIDAGVDVFRLNMSHGDHAGHARNFGNIRALAEERARHIAILADLSGPKIRVGSFEGGGIDLVPEQRVTVTTRKVLGTHGLIPTQYAAFAHDVREGDRVLLADGTFHLHVESVEGTEVQCRVVQGGRLTDKKGINLPGIHVSAPSLTDKDKVDAHFALELGVDFLALSFVRQPDEVLELKQLIADTGRLAAVIAKMERPEALENADAILDAADAIMVARGDLGVEMPPEQVPTAQRMLVDRARAKHRPVIVATQMLESMVTSSYPTRAEVSDVSSAVMSGADAVMLSGETAAGKNPLEAVRMMDRIARHAEGYQWMHGAFGDIGKGQPAAVPPIPLGDAVARATAQLSRDLHVRAIFVISKSGVSVETMSAGRPGAPLVTLSTNAATCRRAALLWGAVPFVVDAAAFKDRVALVRAKAAEMKVFSPGDFLLLVGGFGTTAEESQPRITVLQV